MLVGFDIISISKMQTDQTDKNFIRLCCNSFVAEA